MLRPPKLLAAGWPRNAVLHLASSSEGGWNIRTWVESMAYSVHVLFDGYSKVDETGQEMRANCTCTLIKPLKASGKTVIVDTMTPWDGSRILEVLKETHGLVPDDMDFVVSTHGHSDHIGNNNLFLNAIHIVGQSVSKGDRYILHDFQSSAYQIDGSEVEVVRTPGHTLDSVSVLVRTDQGLVLVAGDLFEREEDLKDENLWKDVAGSEDPDKQRKSREWALQKADFIVPGHGPLFKVIGQE